MLGKKAKPFDGYILISNVSCNDLTNIELLAKNDPFVQIQFGSKTEQTDKSIGAGSSAEWNDLTMKFDASETALRMDTLDVKVFNFNSLQAHSFIGDSSINLSDLLNNIGVDCEKFLELKNKKNKRSGEIKLRLSIHRHPNDHYNGPIEPMVKYVSAEEILKEVSYEKIILPRYKIQLTEKFLLSVKQLLAEQATYIAPKVEAYGLVTKIVNATDNGDIQIIKQTTKEVDKIISTGHTRSIRRIGIWQGDGATYILTASSDGTSKIFDFDSGKYLRKMSGHQGPILCIGVSPDGDVKKAMVATGGVDCTVRVYYLSTGKQRVCLEGHTSKIVSICFTDPKFTVGGNSLIASMDSKSEIRLWETKNCTLLRILNAQTPVNNNQLPS